MTPKEFNLVDQLFERLATLEGTPRDPDAVRAIEEGLARAPNAIYPLVQTVLVQEEALKRAAERIQALEAELGTGSGEGEEGAGGFLDTMRETLFGGGASQGSVPTVRREAAPAWGGSPGHRPMGLPPGVAQGAAARPQAGPASGGSFLGTAGAAAAGVLGGVMVANLFKDLFGGGQAQTAQAQTAQAGSAQDQVAQAQPARDELDQDAGDGSYDVARYDDFDGDSDFWDGGDLA